MKTWQASTYVGKQRKVVKNILYEWSDASHIWKNVCLDCILLNISAFLIKEKIKQGCSLYKSSLLSFISKLSVFFCYFLFIHFTNILNFLTCRFQKKVQYSDTLTLTMTMCPRPRCPEGFCVPRTMCPWTKCPWPMYPDYPELHTDG
jgi:hypothetical protein